MVAKPDSEASWHTDPFGRHEARWWNGKKWTEKVRDGNRISIDPPDITAAPQGVPFNKPASPIPGRRTIRLFGRRLPGAMLLALVVVVAVIVLVGVVLILG
ncbi:DUF2510 domain-containing protein [Candidatus Poriferisocius sp.]|uniref:DUF2510 domain-containing protein n=1 Tax=Candidatus Poriferisocius sp. TaxID=3101276 RepID=UPI003B01E458